MSVNIFWDPNGFELDSLGTKKLINLTDGDTPYVSLSIRMLSIDTPELHYPGNAKPANYNDELKQLAQWIEMGKAPIQMGLAEHLLPKLHTGEAGSLHHHQGERAKEYLAQLFEERLTKPNGKQRSLHIRAANDPMDSHGRLLAYIAPQYSRKELATTSLEDRKTFNLLMVEAGWAAPLLIFPSLPRHKDLKLSQELAKRAVEEGKGIWGSDKTLTGYEYRMCVKLHRVTQKLVNDEPISSRQKNGWIDRYCADMETRKIYYPQEFYKVPPYNRIFIWAKDVTEAVGKMSLLPA